MNKGYSEDRDTVEFRESERRAEWKGICVIGEELDREMEGEGE